MALPEEGPEVVVVGELNVDLLLEAVNALPALEAERRAQGMTLALGSSSAILAANASALGLNVGFVGRIGPDAFGRFVTEALEQRGVDGRYIIETPEVQTGLTAVYTFEGKRGMLTYPGAMDQLTLGDMPWTYIQGAKHLHLSSFYLQRGLRPDCARLFRRAKQAGLTTSLDTNWDPEEVWGDDVTEVLPHVDVFLPNGEEALRISGAPGLDSALEVLAEAGCTVVATRGADGVVARCGDRIIRQPAIPVDPVDAIGAGDSFNAGFLQQYLQDAPLIECIRQGLLAGAFSTQAAGGTAAFESQAAFEQFAAEHQKTA